MRTKLLITNINRLLKIDKWWVYKIGSGVFTLVLLKAIYSSDSTVTFNFSDLTLFSMLILLAVYGHFMNDYSDFEIDKIAGKSNIFNTIPKRIAPIVIVIFGISVISISLWYFSIHVLLFVGLQLLCSILYSIPPFRFKERGLLALGLTGFYERSNPYIIIFLCTLPNWYQIELNKLVFVLFYLIWSYLWECRNFLNGQLKDVEYDEQSDVKSIVIRIGKSQTIYVKKLLLILELLLLTCWLVSLIIIEVNFAYFLLVVLIFQLIQVNGSRTRYRKIEIVLDNCYSNIFMAGFLITITILGIIDPYIAAGIIFFFQYRVIADAIDFIYNRFRHVLIFFWKLWHGEFKKKNQKN